MSSLESETPEAVNQTMAVLPVLTPEELKCLVKVQANIRRWIAQIRSKQVMRDRVGSLFTKLQAYATGRAHRKRWNGILAEYRASPASSPTRHRLKVIAELISTEETYVRGLRILIEHFLQNIHRSLPLLGFSPYQKSIFESLVSSVNAVFSANIVFLQDLRQKMKSCSEFSFHTCMGSMVPHLKLYAPYINTFDDASQFFLQAANIPAFSKLLGKLEQDPSAGGLKLSSYLITPVQRIPRYQLLLQEMIKVTPETHVDYVSLKEVFEQVKSIAVYINESKRQSEKYKDLMKLNERFSSAPNSWPTEMRGWLAKYMRTTSMPKWDFYILRKNKIVRLRRGMYSVKVEDVLTLNEKSTVKIPNISLDSPSRGSIRGLFSQPVASQIKTNAPLEIVGEDRSLTLYSTNIEELNAWGAAIQKAILSVQKYTKNIENLESPLLSKVKAVEIVENCQLIFADAGGSHAQIPIILALVTDALMIGIDYGRGPAEFLECISLLDVQLTYIGDADLAIIALRKITYVIRFGSSETRSKWKTSIEQKSSEYAKNCQDESVAEKLKGLVDEDWSIASKIAETIKNHSLLQRNTISQNSLLLVHHSRIHEKEKKLKEIEHELKSTALKKIYHITEISRLKQEVERLRNEQTGFLELIAGTSSDFCKLSEELDKSMETDSRSRSLLVQYVHHERVFGLHPSEN